MKIMPTTTQALKTKESEKTCEQLVLHILYIIIIAILWVQLHSKGLAGHCKT
jgi:uncharacterized membrane protein